MIKDFKILTKFRQKVSDESHLEGSLIDDFSIPHYYQAMQLSTGKKVLLKQLPYNFLYKQQVQTCTEIRNISLLKNQPSVIQLERIIQQVSLLLQFITISIKDNGQVYLISDLPQFTLEEYIQTTHSVQKKSKLLKDHLMSKQLVRGVAAIHKKQILIRNLNPRSIFISVVEDELKQLLSQDKNKQFLTVTISDLSQSYHLKSFSINKQYQRQIDEAQQQKLKYNREYQKAQQKLKMEQLEKQKEMIERIKLYHKNKKELVKNEIRKFELEELVNNQAKINQFGYKFMNLQEEKVQKNLNYIPPETLLSSQRFLNYSTVQGRTNMKNGDIWSLGCLFYEIFVGEKCFQGDTSPEIMVSIVKVLGLPPKNSYIWEVATPKNFPRREPRVKEFNNYSFYTLPKPKRDIVELCLKWDPSERITADELLEMEYFNDFKEVKIDPNVEQELELSIKTNLKLIKKSDLSAKKENPFHQMVSQDKDQRIFFKNISIKMPSKHQAITSMNVSFNSDKDTSFIEKSKKVQLKTFNRAKTIVNFNFGGLKLNKNMPQGTQSPKLSRKDLVSQTIQFSSPGVRKIHRKKTLQDKDFQFQLKSVRHPQSPETPKKSTLSREKQDNDKSNFCLDQSLPEIEAQIEKDFDEEFTRNQATPKFKPKAKQCTSGYEQAVGKEYFKKKLQVRHGSLSFLNINSPKKNNTKFVRIKRSKAYNSFTMPQSQKPYLSLMTKSRVQLNKRITPNQNNTNIAF